MNWLALPGVVDWIDEDLVAWIDRSRRADGELKRVRKLGTIELLWLMLAVALDTGRNGLHEILRLATAELGLCWKVSTAGFCKARKRLSPQALAVSSRTIGSETVPSARQQSEPVERSHPQGC